MVADRVEIFGVEYDAVTGEEAVERALAFVEEGGPHHICTAAMEQTMTSHRDPEFAEVLRRSELVVPDGISIVWMSRLNRTPLPERVTGVDLVPDLCRAAAERGLSVFFFGAEPGVADEVAERLSARFPGLQVAGTYSPPLGFDSDPEEDARAVQIVREAKPDFLFVALRSPRTEKWIERHREQLGVPVMIGVGAAFNFIAGRERRAPRQIQQWGLEALWRFIQQPRKICARILRNAPLFFFMMLDKKTYRSQKSFLLRIRPVVLALSDAVVAAASFFFAYALYFRWLRPETDPFPGEPITRIPAYTTLIPFVILINFLAILGTGLYQRGPRGSFSNLLKRTAISAATTLVLLITFTFVSKEIFIPHLRGYSRGVFGLFGTLNFLGLLGTRALVQKMEAALHRLGLVADRSILIGDRETCEAVASPMLDRLEQGQIPVGFLEPGGGQGSAQGRLPGLGDLGDLRKIIAARKIDEVVILSPDIPSEDIDAIIETCGEFGVRLSLLPRVPAGVDREFRVRQIGEKRLLSVDGRDLHNLWKSSGASSIH